MIPQHVIIVGAGLAGPALAVGLARRSIRSTIIERRPTVEDLGGVIMLAPNAMRVMDHIAGVGDKIRSKGKEFSAIHIHVQEGDKLRHIGGFTQSQQGELAVSISRPVLHNILVDACRDRKDMIDLRYGTRLSKIHEDENGVKAILEEGPEIQADVLIGADGIGSRVRDHVLGDRRVDPEYSGIVVSGAVVPVSKLNVPSNLQFPAFIYTQGGTFLSFLMDSTDGEMQWATSIRKPERERKTAWNDYRTSGEAVRDIEAEHGDTQLEPIHSFVHTLTDETTRVWAPYQVPDIPTWHTDRVCIVGDAAHAVPPSAGQGAAQAFEDVGLLTMLLSEPKNVELGYGRLFEYFEQKRRGRIDTVRRVVARAEGGRAKTPSSWMWTLKSSAMRLGFWIMGKDGYLSGNTLSGYDVTKERSVIAASG